MCQRTGNNPMKKKNEDRNKKELSQYATMKQINWRKFEFSQ